MHSFELEKLPVVYAVQRFRIYSYGIHFTVITDCSALKQTMQKRDVHARITRWASVLNDYDFELQHRKGEHVFMVEENEYDTSHNSIYVNQHRDLNIQNTVCNVRSGKN